MHVHVHNRRDLPAKLLVGPPVWCRQFLHPRLHSTLSHLLFLAPGTETRPDVNSMHFGTYISTQSSRSPYQTLRGSTCLVLPSIRVPSSRLHSTLSRLLFLAPGTKTRPDINSLCFGTYMTNEEKTAHKSVVKGTNRERALRTVQQSSVAPHRPHASGRMGPLLL
jgi:hypothetical protein